MIIAVDFDGTIVEHEYPKIGKTKLFAFETLKQLQKQGHILILWTYRSGKMLDEAVEFCKKNGIEFFAVNENFKDENFVSENKSRKIYADIYIDDRNIGGFIGWSKIWEIINENSLETKEMFLAEKKIESGRLKNFFNKILRNK